jgi:nitrate/nitrite transporter NarK
MFDGWRGSMIFVGGLSVAIAIIWFLLFRDGTEDADSSTELPSTPKSFTEVIRLPEIWYLSLYYAFFAAGFYAILSLLPSLLLQRGIENGGAYTSLIPLTMIISNIVGGMLSDRFGRVRVLIVCVLLFGVTIPTLLLFDGTLLAFCLILAGIAAGPILPVTTSLPMEMPRIGHVSAGTALGIFFMIGNTGAFLGPLLAGWLTQSSESPWLSFLIFMVLALLAPLFILQLNKTQSLETSKTASG